MMIRQKSRINCIKHGDHSSAFFHRSARDRQSRNCIKSLIDDGGNIFHSLGKIKKW